MYLTDDILVIPTCYYWINSTVNFCYPKTNKKNLPIQNIIIQQMCVFLTQRKDRFELRVHNPQSTPYFEEEIKNPHLLYVVSDILLKFSTTTTTTNIHAIFTAIYERICMELKLKKKKSIKTCCHRHTHSFIIYFLHIAFFDMHIYVAIQISIAWRRV